MAPDASYESVRRWVLKFGPAFARNLRRLRPRPSTQWHLDEMAVVIGGKRLWLWLWRRPTVLRVRTPSAWNESPP
jgi:transposase-like protein